MNNKMESFCGLKCRQEDQHIISDVCIYQEYEKLRQVQAGDVVIDAGAHIGSFTVSVASRAKKIVAFEPEPENFGLLLLNTSNLENTVVHQKALLNATGKFQLYRNRETNAGHSLLSLQEAITKDIIEVDSVKLDDYSLFDVNFIKMDIEGVELQALMGARDTLNKAHPVIAMEAHPIVPLDIWWKSLRDFFSSVDYKILNDPPNDRLWMRQTITAIWRQEK